jgi:peptide/nickel transport system substrate-binding protein
MMPGHLSARLLAVVLTAGGLASCTSPDRDPALRRGSTVVVATEDVDGILPDYTDLDFLPFSPLAVSRGGSKPEPRIARSWQASPDGRIWTYHLRTDVRWHDGEPLTAHDVKFTIDVLDQADEFWGFGFDSVWVVNDSTVKVSAHRHAYVDDIVIYPRHLLEDLDPASFYEWEFWMRPVGSGPYRFVRYVPETLMEFEANPDYFRGKPRIETVILKFVGEGKMPELLSGNADVVLGARPEDAPQIADDDRFEANLEVGTYGGAMGLYLHHGHPLFADARVRRAVTLAIDRREYLRAVGLPHDLPLFDVPATVRQYRRGDVPPPLPYDPDRAMELLEEAGWRDPNGDGVREKGGVPGRFTLLSRSPNQAVLVREYLRRVGLQADILSADLSIQKQRLSAGDFEAAIQVWQGNTHWHQFFFGDSAVTGYANPRVIALLNKAVASSIEDTIDAAYGEIAEIFQRDLPMVFLHPWTRSHYVHRRIRGLDGPLTGATLEQLMEDLWVEEE